MTNPKFNCLSKILHPSRKPKPTFTIMLRMRLKSGEKEPELSSDLQEDNTESLDNVDDENADGYGYFSEFEKGTAQALGPATFDQIDKNITQNEPDVDGVMAQKEHLTKENDKQNSETEKRIKEQIQVSNSEVSLKGSSP